MALTSTDAAGSSTPLRGARWFALVAYVLFVVNAGTNLATPLYERYREAWGFSPAILTIVYALYALTLIPTLPYFGGLSDRWERRSILLAGLAAIALASVVALFARSVEWLYAVRIIQGLALALVSGAASTALGELEPRGDHARSALAATAALTAGGGAGVLLSGYIAQYGSAPLETPFVAHLALLIPAVVGILAMPRLGHRARSVVSNVGADVETPLAPRQRAGVALACAVSFLAFAVLALFLSLGPTIVKSLLHDRSVLLGAYVALDMLGCSALTQIVARRASLRTKLLAGLGTLVVGMGAFVLSASSANVVGVFVTTALGGIGQGLSFLGAVELLERASPPERHGKLVSLLYAASYSGGSVPVVAVGFAASAFGLLPALTTYAASAAVIGVSLLVAVTSFASSKKPHLEGT